MRVLAVLTATGLLGACVTPVGPGPDVPPPMAAGEDCAVIAAVAKEHYRFNTTDNLPPPLWLDGEGSGWAPRCEWSRYGLSFPATFDPDQPMETDGRVQWVSFKQPRYDGRGAVIETGVLHGPMAGMGHECRVISGVAGWTVPEGSCRATWIS